MIYFIARQWGIQPTEFWNMTLSEWFAEYWGVQETRPEPVLSGHKKLTQSMADELAEFALNG